MNPLSKPLTIHQANQEIESLKKKNTQIGEDIEDLRDQINNAPKYSISLTPLSIYLEHLKGLREARDQIKELKNVQHGNNEEIKNLEDYKNNKKKFVTRSNVSESKNRVKSVR